MRTVGGMALSVVLTLGGPAWAGPHADGVLIVHINPELEYTSSIFSYQGQSGLRDCREAITEGEVSSEKAQIWFVLASFSHSPGPVDLVGAEFGFADFDTRRINLVGYGACNDGCYEISSEGWPGPRQGTTIVFDSPQHVDPIELYWFASYVYGPVAIELGLRPGTEMAVFCDSSVPTECDEAVDFGVLGLGQSGYNPCGGTPTEGTTWGAIKSIYR